jgi:ketosteroid isomerase-like protein
MLLLAGCGSIPPFDAAAEERAIRQVIADMETAWNRGDFAGYMRGFKNPDVVFVSRGQFQRDWQGMKLVGHGDQREGRSRKTVLRFSV